MGNSILVSLSFVSKFVAEILLPRILSGVLCLLPFMSERKKVSTFPAFQLHFFGCLPLWPLGSVLHRLAQKVACSAGSFGSATQVNGMPKARGMGSLVAVHRRQLSQTFPIISMEGWIVLVCSSE